MPININPAMIAGAFTFQPPVTPIVDLICKPPLEGSRVMSFTINGTQSTTGAYNVNLTQGTPQALFSQIACMMIDALNSASDITILFPDTGFQYTIPASDTRIFPVVTNGLQFYVIFNYNSAPFNAGDSVNVYCFNHYIPNVENNIYTKTTEFANQPAFANEISKLPAPVFANWIVANSKAFSAAAIPLTLSGGGFPITTLKGVLIELVASAAGAPTQYLVSITGKQSLSNYYQKMFTAATTLSQITLDQMDLMIDIQADDNDLVLSINNCDNLNSFIGLTIELLVAQIFIG